MSTSIIPTESRALAFSNIPPQPLAWLWQNYIPRGKLSLLAGDPGSGKTALALDLAARLSRADRLPPFPAHPDLNRNPNRNQNPLPPTPAIESLGPPPLTTDHCPLATLLLSPEDNLADTLRPRLESLNADASLIHTLPNFHSLVDPVIEDGPAGSREVPALTHLDWVCQSIPNLALLVIDPITYYLGLTDRKTPSSPQTPSLSPRSILHSLAKLAHMNDIAILLTTRLTKKCSDADPTSLRRALGSLAFAAAARTVHLLLPNSDLAGGPADQPGHTLFAPLKNNLAELPPALAFFPDGQGRLEWDPDPIFIPYPNAGKNPPRTAPNEESQLGQAVKFLRQALANGPVRATSLQTQAEENLVTIGTLRRAKDFLDCDAEFSGIWNAWFWSLKGDKRPILTPMQKLEKAMSISASADPFLQQLERQLQVTTKPRKKKSAQVRKKTCAPAQKRATAK